MKLPKGFRKNYFRLQAITATTNYIALQKDSSRVESFHIFKTFSEDELEDEAPPECELLLQTTSQCNCYYVKRAKKALKLCSSAHLPTLYFQTLNSSISPPVRSTDNGIRNTEYGK
ncbi:MAG: hypothetical protein WC144_00440 [Sulfurimonas sp.]|jgi:hypothetical protein|nr:hypothetical protein [Sulfurimonadaceae bacterium]